MKERNIFGELKRRNVYKVAVAYVVVSWLLIQAASILFPTFEAPPWVMKVFVCILVFGFPLALLFSWAFEITPEGIKRESEVDRDESITAHTGRKIVTLTIALALIAAGLLTFQLLRSKTKGNQASGTAAPTADAPLIIPEKSIAVLPFENLSDEKSNAYFADGIQDEILTRLSKVAALKVISRTSTQKYKSAPDNLREVGKQLGVANLLEGSVQKIANAVHVNVQLIRVATDEHLWAESYNRKLDDVFAVEGEVATAIAEQLNAKLTGAEEKVLAAKPTHNAAAYDAYLRAISIENAVNGTEPFQNSARELHEAVRLDPNFALAWARLALARSYLYFNGVNPAENSGAAVKEPADRALALQPELGEAWLAQGVYRYRVLRDFGSALQSYTEALKRLPNSSLVLEQMAHLERRLGRPDQADKHYRAAAQLDPRNIEILFTISDLLASSRRFDEASAMLDRILQISPGNETVYVAKALQFQLEGRLKESASELAKVAAGSHEETTELARFLQFYYERRFDAAIAQFESSSPLFKDDPRSITSVGFCQDWLGRKSDARATFTRAISAMKTSPSLVVPVDARQLPCYLAWAHAGLGNKSEALDQARKAVADYDGDVLAKPFAEITLAWVQAWFGDADSAIAALPHLLEVPAGLTRGQLRIDPAWDPLRKDPRFAKLTAEP